MLTSTSFSLITSAQNNIEKTITLQGQVTTVNQIMLGAWLGENAITTTEVHAALLDWTSESGKGLDWIDVMGIFGYASNPQPLFQIDDYKPLIQAGLVEGVYITWQTSEEWEPWDGGGVTTQAVAKGQYDNYIHQQAINCKNANYPIIIRINQEFNGDWAGWGTNSTTYILMWKHIVDIFRAEGANNVKFFWCANYADTGGRHFQDYYPGDLYVDYVGIDMYANNDWSWWSNPEKQLGNTYGNVYDTYNSKPFIIGEWGLSSSITEQQNADWITAFFNAVESRSNIIAINHWRGTQDGWSVDLHPQAFDIYKNRIATNLYLPN